jgi:hypothetical protein
MASRDYTKHIVLLNQPSSSNLGDEWFNPSTNKLYKRVANNGTTVEWREIPSSSITAFTVTSANGFTGTVTTATSTPAITLTTSITGLLKGNGTAISAAVANTDYVSPTRVVTIADATSISIDANITDVAVQTNTQATGTLTINAPSGTLIDGQKLVIRLSSTAVQTFSFNAVFAGSTDQALPTVSTSGGKYDYMGFQYNSAASKWQFIAKNFGF